MGSGLQHQRRPLRHHDNRLRKGLSSISGGSARDTVSSSVVCQSRKGEGSFWGGFLVGGAIFGALGFLFAPQVSRALLNSEKMKKLLGDGNENLEITREMLNDKISELISAIDGVSAQLQSSSSKGNANN